MLSPRIGERLLNLLVNAKEQRMKQLSICNALECSQRSLRLAVEEINLRQLAEITFCEDDVILHLSLPLLDTVQLRNRIGGDRFGYIPCLDSTQAWLHRHLQDPLANGFSLFSECQTGGRGRYGRRWFSPLASQFIMSQCYRVIGDPDALAGITVEIAHTLTAYLQRSFSREITCKWPNDIFYRAKKLGGILSELLPLEDRRYRLLIGIGLNLRLPAFLDVGQPAESFCNIAEIDRTTFTFSLWQKVTNTVLDYLERVSSPQARKESSPPSPMTSAHSESVFPRENSAMKSFRNPRIHNYPIGG